MRWVQLGVEGVGVDNVAGILDSELTRIWPVCRHARATTQSVGQLFYTAVSLAQALGEHQCRRLSARQRLIQQYCVKSEVLMRPSAHMQASACAHLSKVWLGVKLEEANRDDGKGFQCKIKLEGCVDAVL